KALTIDAAQILGVARQLGTITPGKAAHLVVTEGDFQEAKTQVRYVFADGVRFAYDAQTQQADARRREDAKKPDGAKAAEAKKSEDAKAAEVATIDVATELEADRKPKQQTGGNVLIRGATVLTVTNGTLPRTDLLVRDGKIAQIGPNLGVPEGTLILE